MKRLNFCLPLLTAGLVAATPIAKCQETNSPPPAASLSLDTLIVEALEKNPELKFYEAELAVARAGRKTAGLWANPEVSGSVGQKRVTTGGLSDEGLAW